MRKLVTPLRSAYLNEAQGLDFPVVFRFPSRGWRGVSGLCPGAGPGFLWRGARVSGRATPEPQAARSSCELWAESCGAAGTARPLGSAWAGGALALSQHRPRRTEKHHTQPTVRDRTGLSPVPGPSKINFWAEGLQMPAFIPSEK